MNRLYWRKIGLPKFNLVTKVHVTDTSALEITVARTHQIPVLGYKLATELHVLAMASGTVGSSNS